MVGVRAIELQDPSIQKDPETGFFTEGLKSTYSNPQPLVFRL